MARRFPRTWFAHLPPAEAARFVVLLERVRQGDWLRIARMPDRRLALRRGNTADEFFVFGNPDDGLITAVQTLHKETSPLIFRRFKGDHTFGAAVLLEAVRALLDGDVDLTRGLLRRMVGTTVGFEVLAQTTEGNPKSLVARALHRGLETQAALEMLEITSAHSAGHRSRRCRLFRIQVAVREQ